MSRFTRGLALAISVLALVAGGTVAHAQVGTQLASYYGPCSAGNGRAVAYHNGILYYTNFDYSNKVYEVNAASGACVGNIQVVRSVAALTWDSKRNLFWGGAYDGSGDVITIDPTTGASAVAFNTIASTAGDGTCCPGYIDGLAYDSSTDSLWFSNDLSQGTVQTIFRFTPKGSVVQTFKVAPVGGYGNSGIAFDGSLLWLAFPGARVIQTFDRGTTGGALATPLGSFSTGGFDTEGMTFDNETFSPKCAVWINNASYWGNYLTAFEVTCPLVADAYTARLTIDGAPAPVRVNTLGDARVAGENAKQSNSVQQVVLPNGLGTITLGDNSAATTVDAHASPLVGTATARADIASVDLLGGMVTGHAIRSASNTSTSNGIAKSNDDGTDLASISVAGTPVNVPAQAQQTISLPNGIGTLALNERIANGTGKDLSELEVRALHLNATVGGATVDLIIGSAYSGIAFSGALTPRPATSPAVEPGPSLPVPGGGGPAGNPMIPALACPDPCYQPTPADNASLSIPGIISVNRSSYVYGNSGNGSRSGVTSVDLLGGQVGFAIQENIAHGSYSSSNYARDFDGKSLVMRAYGPGGIQLSGSTHRSIESSSNTYGSSESSHYLDIVESTWSFNSPAGTAVAGVGFANQSDEAHYGSYSYGDTRKRTPTITLEFDPAAGTTPIIAVLTLSESSSPDQTGLVVGGFVVVNGQRIAIPPRV